MGVLHRFKLDFCREMGVPAGRRRRPMYKVLTIDLKEYLFFSAGFEIKTCLLDVRNKMKNVLDELYVIGLYKH